MSDGQVPIHALVYRIYLHATPERVWQALVRPEDTASYWGVRLTSDWTVGAPITWLHAGVTFTDPGSIVRAFEPPRRLSYTWHRNTVDYARAVGMDEATRQRLNAESRSTITFELEPFADQVKLTLRQDGFDAGSAKLASLTETWPRLMSELKTYLEAERPATARP